MSQVQKTRKPNRFRVTSIIIAVAVVSLMMSAFLPGICQAGLFSPNAMYQGNLTEETDGEGVVLFDWDFESEITGTMPTFGQCLNWDHENLSISTIDMGGDYGKVLGFNQTLQKTTVYEGRAHIGHTLQGIFDFSFDFYPAYCTAANPPLTSFHIGLMIVAYGSGVDFEFDSLINGSGKVTFDGGAKWTDISVKQWHHINMHLNTLNQTMVASLDGVENTFISVSAFAYETIHLKMWTWTADRTLDVRLDNIRVTYPRQIVQGFPFPEETRTAIALVFDDGRMSAYTNASVDLGSYPGSLAVVTWWVGTPTHMGWAEIQNLSDAGWEILSHGVTHTDMTALSDSALRAEFLNSKRSIEENVTNCTVTGFIYPGNSRSNATDLVGWEYYDYLGGTPAAYTAAFDLIRKNFDLDWSQSWYLLQMVPAAVYGYYGFVDLYAHDVENPKIYSTTVNRTLLQYFIDKMVENGTTLTIPSERYRPVRNAFQAIVSGDSASFTTSFGEVYENFTCDDSWYKLPNNLTYGPGEYVITPTSTYGYLSSGTHAHVMTAMTSIGYLNLSIIDWSTWTANASDPAAIAAFTLSGLESGTTYKVYIDDVIMATIIAVGGQISFAYSAWSTHTFAVIVPTTYIAPNDVPPSEKSPSSSDPGTTSFSWTSPALIAIVSCSVLIALVLLLRRPRGRSGTRHS